MSKIRGFLLHLAISTLVVGVALGVIFYVWYPYPYFQIAGAWNVVKILVGVDLVLGPALTLLLYRPGKRMVKLDLTVIALIQIAALVYGLTTIHGERPLYMVFAVDRFVMLSERDVDPATLPAAIAAERPRSGPLYALAELPTDTEAHQKLLFELIDGAPDIEYRPELWRPLSANPGPATERVRPLADIGWPNDDPRLAGFRNRVDEVGFLPVLYKTETPRALIVDIETLRPVGVLDIDPFEL